MRRCAASRPAARRCGVRPEQAPRPAPRDAVEGPGPRIGLERAGEQRFAVLAHVERAVRITQHGQLPAGRAEPRDRLGEDVLMLERHDREGVTEQAAGELAGPLSGGEHDLRGTDLAGGGLERPRAALAEEARHGRAAPDACALLSGSPGERVRDGGGVDPAVGRQMGGGDQPGGIEQRKERLRPIGRDDLERHADLVGDPLDAPELVDPVAGGREPKRARLVVGDVERAVQVDAAPQQRHQVVAPRVLGAEAGRVPRRALRELVLLEQDDVRLRRAASDGRRGCSRRCRRRRSRSAPPPARSRR